MPPFIGKDKFFFEPSPAQVRKHAREVRDVYAEPEELATLLQAHPEDIAFRLTNCIDKKTIIPEEHYAIAYGGPYELDGLAGEVSWHFLRHGNEASMTQFKSTKHLRDTLRNLKRTPKEHLPPHIAPSNYGNIAYFFIEQLAAAYQRAFQRDGSVLSGFTWKPILGTDGRIRKTFLTEQIEARWLMSYCEQDERLAIQIAKFYDDVQGVLRDGANVKVDYIPSRTPRRPPYELGFHSFPVGYNDMRQLIAYSLASTLSNHPEKNNLNRQHRRLKDRKDTNYHYWVAQEIAGYWQAMRKFYGFSAERLNKVNKRRVSPRYARIVPLEVCPFRIANEDTISYYLNMLDRVIVAYRDENGKIKDRKLTKGEQEIELTGYVKSKRWGVWDTFFLPIGNKMQDIDWMNRPIRPKIYSSLPSSSSPE